jgi:hypothetical protein
MKDLSIQPGKNASGNKRAAPESQGQIREDRPNKLRSSMDDYNGHGLSQNPGRAATWLVTSSILLPIQKLGRRIQEFRQEVAYHVRNPLQRSSRL